MNTKIRIECPIDFFETNLQDFEVVDDSTASILIANPGSSYMYNGDYLDKFKQLKVLASPSTGVTHIDLDYCQKTGIPVLTLLEDRASLNNIHASAEFTWMHVLGAMRNFNKALNAVRNNQWRDVEADLRGEELHGKTIGIIGLGRIGSKVAKFATAFGMNVLYYDPFVVTDTYTKVNDLADIAKQSDVITINCYLTNETRGMIDKAFIHQCKNGAIIVNTARGEVVNEEDVIEAVLAEHIKYSTDVVQNEQKLTEFRSSNLLACFKCNRITITPHIAGATIQSQAKAFSAIIGIIKKHLESKNDGTIQPV